MKTKIKLFVILGVIILLIALYLISINSAITGSAIKNSKDFDKVKEKDCWELDDGRTICKLGTIEVSAGGVVESDYEVKDKNKTKQQKEKD